MTWNKQTRTRSCSTTLLDLAVILPILVVALLHASVKIQAQTPVSELAKPPAGAQAFTILSTSGTNGKGYIWTGEDGSSMSRDSVLLRGMVWEMDQRAVLGSERDALDTGGARRDPSSGRRGRVLSCGRR